MLTRAYDTIMAALQVPIIMNQNVDFNTSAIDDSVLNCKNYNGNVRTVLAPGHYNGTAFGSSSIYGSHYPFSFWTVSTTYYGSCLLPDEDETEPNYEDYSVTNQNPSDWTIGSQYPSFSKAYDPDAKEIVCSVKTLYQNTSGAAKTVYGVKVRCNHDYRKSWNSNSSQSDFFLVCREHFAAPVVVDDQGIISLTFTWRVGRAGLVSATAASAV